MEIIDYELTRYDQWKDDLEKRKRYFENNTGLCLLPAMCLEGSDKKVRVIEDMWTADGPLDVQIKKHSVDEPISISDDEIQRLKEDIEKSRKKFKNLVKKQEQLLKGLSLQIKFF